MFPIQLIAYRKRNKGIFARDRIYVYPGRSLIFNIVTNCRGKYNRPSHDICIFDTLQVSLASQWRIRSLANLWSRTFFNYRTDTTLPTAYRNLFTKPDTNPRRDHSFRRFLVCIHIRTVMRITHWSPL